MSSRLDALNRWLGIVSNFGVIGGFVLLAVQLNQNTRALELETAHALNLEAQASELALLGDDGATAYADSILQPAQVSPGGLLRVWAYLSGGLQPSLNTWIAWKQGAANGEYITGDWVSIQNQPPDSLGVAPAAWHWDSQIPVQRLVWVKDQMRFTLHYFPVWLDYPDAPFDINGMYPFSYSEFNTDISSVYRSLLTKSELLAIARQFVPLRKCQFPRNRILEIYRTIG